MYSTHDKNNLDYGSIGISLLFMGPESAVKKFTMVPYVCMHTVP